MDIDKPTIGITMGDPAGIGAEVIVKALARPEIRALARFVIFGLDEQLRYAADDAEINPFWLRDHHENVTRYDHENILTAGNDCIVLDYDELTLPGPMETGSSKTGGLASMDFCTDAIAAAKKKTIDAIVTAPISKESWAMAGYHFPGHTELLAKNFKAKRVAMMFAAPQIRVVLATIHEQLFEIRHGFTIGRVFTPIDLADAALKKWWGIEKPKIAVCGLNPHAGEAGRFGDEEKRIIKPAILMATEAGIDVEGPFPADTIFIEKNRRRFDCIIAMYHDQGLIPVKMLAFNEAVNVTLGLPVVRTSPDHGTAFDIAHRNRADEGSMAAAIKLAVDLAGKKPVKG